MSATAFACQPQQRQDDSRYYLWDARTVDCPDDGLFEPQVWRDAGRLSGEARGRGAAWFLRPEQGGAWVLRHSRRGGLMAHVSADRYGWLGLNRCRVFQEFRLLAELVSRGLPVAKPVAARVLRHGCCYSGDLITVQVPNAQPLADWLATESLSESVWRQTGAIISRFHGVGVYHHDLNARNILIDDDRNITLIDFDKSSIRRAGRWQGRNLERLGRSLNKIAGRQSGLHFSESDWQALLSGYEGYRPV